MWQGAFSSAASTPNSAFTLLSACGSLGGRVRPSEKGGTFKIKEKLSTTTYRCYSLTYAIGLYSLWPSKNSQSCGSKASVDVTSKATCCLLHESLPALPQQTCTDSPRDGCRDCSIITEAVESQSKGKILRVFQVHMGTTESCTFQKCKYPRYFSKLHEKRCKI